MTAPCSSNAARRTPVPGGEDNHAALWPIHVPMHRAHCTAQWRESALGNTVRANPGEGGAQNVEAEGETGGERRVNAHQETEDGTKH